MSIDIVAKSLTKIVIAKTAPDAKTIAASPAKSFMLRYQPLKTALQESGETH